MINCVVSDVAVCSCWMGNLEIFFENFMIPRVTSKSFTESILLRVTTLATEDTEVLLSKRRLLRQSTIR